MQGFYLGSFFLSQRLRREYVSKSPHPLEGAKKLVSLLFCVIPAKALHRMVYRAKAGIQCPQCINKYSGLRFSPGRRIKCYFFTPSFSRGRM